MNEYTIGITYVDCGENAAVHPLFSSFSGSAAEMSPRSASETRISTSAASRSSARGGRGRSRSAFLLPSSSDGEYLAARGDLAPDAPLLANRDLVGKGDNRLTASGIYKRTKLLAARGTSATVLVVKPHSWRRHCRCPVVAEVVRCALTPSSRTPAGKGADPRRAFRRHTLHADTHEHWKLGFVQGRSAVEQPRSATTRSCASRTSTCCVRLELWPAREFGRANARRS